MSHNKHIDKNKSEKNKNQNEDENQKWFDRDDFQDLAKIGGDIFKKTVATGRDVIKEVKDNFPKYIVTLDDFALGTTTEGIQIIHLREFLSKDLNN